jgi:DNA (cytosine-5)-methyltransferase 1
LVRGSGGVKLGPISAAPFRYLSVCSGIEAATAAWHPLGWQPAAFAEIEPFPRAVLQYRYPEVPLHGDFTTIGADEYGAIDLLVGGTPCQSFSIAGLRGGLADDRGNLALEFLRLADRKRPRWLVWENVPGVLSIDGGRAFGAILGGLVELGYGFAYRVLDAQHFGVPQRRRRVFVVGYLGDWRRAAAVLFERHSLSGHPAPRRQTGQVAPTVPSRGSAGGGLGTDFDCDGGLIEGYCPDIVPQAMSSKWSKGSSGPAGDEYANLIAPPLTSNPYGDHESREGLLTVTHSLRGEGFDASEDGTGRGTPIIPIDMRQASRGTTMTNNRAEGSSGGAPGTGIGEAGDPSPTIASSHVPAICFSAKDHGADAMEDCSPTLRAGGHAGSHANAGVMPAVCFDTTQITSAANYSNPKPGGPCHPLAAGAHPPAIANSAVRRLTPEECEKLQGFEPGFTQIPWRGKPASECPDGPRYKALGNSMAVPCMRWIGERIAMSAQWGPLLHNDQVACAIGGGG